MVIAMRLRVTSQMLENNRRRSGRSSGGSSLLKYVNNKGTGGSSRLKSMNTGSVRANRLMAKGYESLEKSSLNLKDQIRLLGEKVDGKDGNDHAEDKDKKITDQVEKMVDSFNDTLNDLKQSSGVLNEYYYQTLRNVSLDNKAALEDIGITVTSGGSLTLDRGKLESADWEKVKKLLGSEGSFMKRMDYVASRVADNARTNAESLSSRYNSRGDLDSSYLSRINYRR